MTAVTTNGTNTALVYNAGNVYTAVPFSMVIDCAVLSSGIIMAQLAGANPWSGHYIQYSGGVQVVTASNVTFAVTTSIPSSVHQRRQLIVGVWKSDASRQCFCDGVPSNIETTSKAPNVTPTDLTIGAGQHDLTTDNFAKLEVYNAAIYSCALELGDIALLMRGAPLENIRPGCLVDGWYMSGPDLAGPGSSQPLYGVRRAFVLTQTGTGAPVPGRVPTAAKYRPLLMTRRLDSAVSVPAGVVFRRTLSSLGARMGSRQVHRV